MLLSIFKTKMFAIINFAILSFGTNYENFYNQENITKQLSPLPQTIPTPPQPWNGSNPQFINFKYELNKQPTGNLFNILPKKETLDSNEKIYKDNWAKSCATNPEVCYNPVIKRIQNKNGKVDTNYNYNTRNLLRSRFLTYEQNAYNFDLTNSHFYPALLKKIFLAKQNNKKSIKIWWYFSW